MLGLVWLIPIYLLLVNAFKPTDSYDADKIWVPDTSFGLFANLREAWTSAGLGESIAQHRALQRHRRRPSPS